MASAVEVVLAGDFPAYSTGDFEDTDFSWLQIEREAWCFSSLKRPHSGQNPWPPECGQFSSSYTC